MDSTERAFSVGIYGGTFAPPHNGHIAALKAFMEMDDISAFYVVPTSIPPHKRIDAEADRPEDRLNMLEAALNTLPGWGERLFISDYEIDNPGKSYTVLTLEHFAAAVSSDLTFLCGADMFATLESWYRAKDIFRLARIAYLERPGTDADLSALAGLYRDKYGARCVEVRVTPTDVSSTRVRAAAAAGLDYSGLVPEAVREYIDAHNLYRKGEGANQPSSGQ